MKQGNVDMVSPLSFRTLMTSFSVVVFIRKITIIAVDSLGLLHCQLYNLSLLFSNMDYVFSIYQAVTEH